MDIFLGLEWLNLQFMRLVEEGREHFRHFSSISLFLVMFMRNFVQFNVMFP